MSYDTLKAVVIGALLGKAGMMIGKQVLYGKMGDLNAELSLCWEALKAGDFTLALRMSAPYIGGAVFYYYDFDALSFSPLWVTAMVGGFATGYVAHHTVGPVNPK